MAKFNNLNSGLIFEQPNLCRSGERTQRCVEEALHQRLPRRVDADFRDIGGNAHSIAQTVCRKSQADGITLLVDEVSRCPEKRYNRPTG